MDIFTDFIRKGALPPLSEKRIVSLDAIKALASLCVVIMHTLRNLDAAVPNHSTLYYFTRIAMPLFFMVSGYLQLYGKKCTYRYSLHKVIKIFLLASGWVLIFDFALYIFNGSPFSLSNLFTCYIQRGSYSVFWFFGSMIILYLLLPALQKIFARERAAVVFTGAFMLLCVSIHIVSIIYASRHGVFLQAKVIQTFRLWTWIFYFCLGGCIKKFKVNERFHSIKLLLPLCVVLSTIVIIDQNYLFKIMTHVVNGEFYYDSPLLMLLTAGIFLLLMNIKYSAPVTRFVRFLSVNLIGIYVFHIHIIKIIAPHLPPLGFFEELLVVACVIVMTLLISTFVTKIPYVNRLIRL